MVYVTADEVSIATILNETVEKFPKVSFGSYPKLFHRLVITAWTLSSGCNEIRVGFMKHFNILHFIYQDLLIIIIIIFSYYKTKITLESLDPSVVSVAKEYLESKLPEGRPLHKN